MVEKDFKADRVHPRIESWTGADAPQANAPPAAPEVTCSHGYFSPYPIGCSGYRPIPNFLILKKFFAIIIIEKKEKYLGSTPKFSVRKGAPGYTPRGETPLGLFIKKPV